MKWVFVDRDNNRGYNVYIKSQDRKGDVTKTFLMWVESYEEAASIAAFWDAVKDHLT